MWVSRGYTQKERPVEVVSSCCVWYNPGLVVPIRYVLVRAPRGKFKTQALLGTDLRADPVLILSWFVSGWQREVPFQEVRRHRGVETQRQWNEATKGINSMSNNALAWRPNGNGTRRPLTGVRRFC